MFSYVQPLRGWSTVCVLVPPVSPEVMHIQPLRGCLYY